MKTSILLTLDSLCTMSNDSNFHRNSDASSYENFQLLVSQRGWKVGSKRYRVAHGRWMADEFNRCYGSNENRLEGWRALCADVGIKNIPDSITQCKKVE